jgi:F-type H+-transporting ATPase subunit b
MQFDWWTFGFEVINFVVLMAIVHRLLYKPVVATISARQEQIASAEQEAEALRSHAKELEESYRHALDQVDTERAERLEQTRREIEEEHRKALDEAREEVGEMARAVRVELAKEREAAGEEILSRATEVSVELAKSLLREARFPNLAEPFLERAREHLASLPKERLQHLIDQRGAERTIRIVTAPELGLVAQDLWRARFEDIVGPGTIIEFDADDELIAGVDVYLPGGVLRLSWREILESSQRELVRHADTT